MCNPVETKYQCGQCIVNGGQHKDIVVVGAMTRVDRAVRLTLVTLQALQRQVRDVRLCNLTTTDTAWELRTQMEVNAAKVTKDKSHRYITTKQQLIFIKRVRIPTLF